MLLKTVAGCICGHSLSESVLALSAKTLAIWLYNDLWLSLSFPTVPRRCCYGGKEEEKNLKKNTEAEFPLSQTLFLTREIYSFHSIILATFLCFRMAVYLSVSLRQGLLCSSFRLALKLLCRPGEDAPASASETQGLQTYTNTPSFY